MACELHLKSKFNLIYKIFNYSFSDARPSFRIAFDAHTSDLAESAYEFLDTKNGTANLNNRLKKSITLDKKLMAARIKLIEHIENAEVLRIDNILR